MKNKVLVHPWMLEEIQEALCMIWKLNQPNLIPLSDKSFETIPTVYDSSIKIISKLLENKEDFYINKKVLERIKYNLNRINSEYKCYKRDTCFARTISNARYKLYCILTNKEWQYDHFCYYTYKENEI